MLNQPSETWDEGMPCGNGVLGSLLWGQPDRLKLSLDCTELWDTTPIPEFECTDYSFSFVEKQVQLGDLEPVRQLLEEPYETRARPTKLPGARIEFQFKGEEWKESGISYENACSWQRWHSGRTFQSWISATRRLGVIEIQGKGPDHLHLLNPYSGRDYEQGDGYDLSMPVSALGYDETRSISEDRFLGYVQQRLDGGSYAVALSWTQVENRWLGAWTIVTDVPDPISEAKKLLHSALSGGVESIRKEHLEWWAKRWSESSLRLDDDILTRSWYYNRYLFASACRLASPPITLQGPWTCDNGYLPPWKGNYHHDLNTQYSYYHALSGNQLDGFLGFLNWLWLLKPAGEAWTHRFFGCAGLNVPACMDIKGNSLGGWHQYTHSPTTAGWLSHLFFLYWRYSMDRDFLREKAYPWISACALFFEQHTRLDQAQRRCFPLSSSPEIHDNTLSAWFVTSTTQYDLSILRMVFEKASEMALELDLIDEANHWKDRLAECPDLLISDSFGLLLAPETPLEESHRHHSHLMAIHPFETLSWEQGTAAQRSILKSLSHLDNLGTNEWVGYSWGWRAVMWACARNGDRAAQDVHLFLRAFCSKNGFHLNGDQSGEGHCHWTYRPFTLEGNFLSALALQYMVLQSSGGLIRVFPAMPDKIRSASFEMLRAEGALLISAKREAGRTKCVSVFSERGGPIRLQYPFSAGSFKATGSVPQDLKSEGGIIQAHLAAGQSFTLEYFES